MCSSDLPTYVERISHLGLSASSGNLSLAYRPINTSTLTYQDVYFSGNTAGVWNSPVFLKTTTNSPTDVIQYCSQRICYGLRGTDGNAYILEGN